MSMKSLSNALAGAIATVAVGLVGLFGLTPSASAAYDPHVPIPPYWCPGGGVFSGWGGHCEGVSYPDGTRWNFNSVMGVITPMQCVVFTGQPNPPLAGPGGCGGAI
jgi:hypothetical protein